ncbi:RHS repeat domain-containing protein, partial [Phaeodactylibacter xiamenensis]|uniref:RHS repeat domain-containing protein n=1 Tax=Phaeodactylibacter xiamenensis TaxID=1524460 RepID=UPI0024A8AD9A
SPQNCFEPGLIDDLGYTYDTQSGHLVSVRDGAPSGFKDYGFKDGAPGNDYTYDDNGNLIRDNNKNLSFTYNYLNLPRRIGQARFVYDADGTKWRKIGEDGITEYANGIIFKDGRLEAVMGKSGRLVAEGLFLSQGMRAEYWHQDHTAKNGVKGPCPSLTRLAFSDYVVQDGVIETQDDPNTPQNDIEITQELHYYPFGMEQLGSWYSTVAPDNDYRYNGKELNDDYGIGLYDYGARWYDAAIGRFTTIDRFAEKYYSYSSYGYAASDPIKHIDVNGDSLNVSELINGDENVAGDPEGAAKLIGDLESVTGLDLSVGESGNVSISGRSRDENGKKVKGSKTARKTLKKLIKSETTVSIYNNPGGGNEVINHENRIGYDSNQFGFLQNYLSPDLNKQTWGPGLTFFHELGHTEYGGGLADPGGKEAYITSGEIEIIPNKIRRELGPRYGQRHAYKHTTIGSNRHLPFSKGALDQIKEGIVPTNGYHGI